MLRFFIFYLKKNDGFRKVIKNTTQKGSDNYTSLIDPKHFIIRDFSNLQNCSLNLGKHFIFVFKKHFLVNSKNSLSKITVFTFIPISKLLEFLYQICIISFTKSRNLF